MPLIVADFREAYNVMYGNAVKAKKSTIKLDDSIDPVCGC